jgi:hypothetical protein
VGNIAYSERTQSSNLNPPCERRPGILVGCESGCRIPVTCKQWKCWYCGRRLVRRFIARTRAAVYTWMFTFTTGQELTQQTAKVLNARVREFRRLFKQNVAPIQDWTWVNEVGTQGEHVLHKHMLVVVPRAYLPYKDVHRVCDRAGLAAWRKFSRVADAGAVPYLAKYLAKELVGERPRYYRRSATSVPKLSAKSVTFEPLAFVPIDETDATDWSEAVNTETGLVYSEYTGPSYGPVPLYLIPQRDSVEVAG